MKKKWEIPPKSIKKPCFSLRDLFRSIRNGRFAGGKKIISQKAPRNDSFRPFLIFQHFFSKIDEDFWPFCYLQPICCVSVCPQGPFFYKKSHFWRKSVIYLFKKLKKPNFFAKKSSFFPISQVHYRAPSQIRFLALPKMTKLGKSTKSL